MTTFDPMRGPSALATGNQGTLLIGGLHAGTLSEWRIVVSPSTQKFTLFGQGRFLRYYIQHVGGLVRLALTPAPVPTRIGRPKPKTPAPFVLEGKLFELTAGRITISEGELARD